MYDIIRLIKKTDANGKAASSMKQFKTTGLCTPEKNYMVDITDRLKQIREMVDKGDYFTINRARQFGKTTTLAALESYLRNDYDVISLDFQDIGDEVFSNEFEFVKGFSNMLCDAKDYMGAPLSDKFYDEFKEMGTKTPIGTKLNDLFRLFFKWCKENEKPIILIIDEVDSASNNQVFLDFLAGLRSVYLKREKRPDVPAFHSVILAGVNDIKHLKATIRPEEQSKVNSPWNISADFDIDMTLSTAGIKGMLDEYEADHNTGMNTRQMAERIYEYTHGYPFLVSRICLIIDTKLVPDKFATLSEAWTDLGFDEAIKILLSESNMLFESLTGKLTNYPELREKLRGILLRGDTLEYLPYDEAQQQLRMYGFIRNEHNTCVVFNKLFEITLYKQFLGKSRYDELKQLGTSEKSIFIEDGVLNVPKIMQHFIDSQRFIYDRLKGETEEEAEKRTEKFLENEGRERFLTYLSPIINGVGTYSIEEQTRDHKRMDIVIHYLGKRYIIEVKIWRGERYNADGEQQLIGYLDRFGLDVGYMLSFNFNKSKKIGVERISVGGKTLFEGTM